MLEAKGVAGEDTWRLYHPVLCVTPPEPYQVTQRPTGKESAMASQYTPSWLSCRQETAAAVRCMDATSRGMDALAWQPGMLNFDKDTLATQQFGRSSSCIGWTVSVYMYHVRE